MTWMSSLYETYESNSHAIGIFEKKGDDQEYALLPISHTTQAAQIELAIDDNGNFISAKVVDKADASTIIPCTEASSSRTSSPVPHPLFDRLVYVAGDYAHFGGKAKKGNPHKDYMEQLKQWCDSPYSHPKVVNVYKYLSKGTLIQDLVNANILFVDENQQLIQKWKSSDTKEDNKPAIFKVVPNDQSDAFVRFAVNIIGDTEPRLWRDKTVWDSFIAFYNEQLSDYDLCFISGKTLPYADKHATKIRHPADMTKLISANDLNGFTFRGRFRNSRDAVSVSYEVSQKAHSALKWLITKQGFQIDGKVFLVWGKDNLPLPDPLSDFDALFNQSETDVGDLTHREFAKQVKLAIGGYRHTTMNYKSDIIIMVVDAATPGRLSIVYYRNMDKEVFLNKLEDWHLFCCWLHQYKKDKKFYGAPATRDIAFAAYGSNASGKVVKGLIERMLPSILDGRRIPFDIVRSAINRSSNPVSMDPWEWEKTLSITCALIKHEKEDFNVTLDPNETSRDYLFGRLLAVADVLERNALSKDEKRATNAIRYMNAFAQRPSRTWNIIQSSIQPYQAKLGTGATYYNRLIDEIGSQITPKDFVDTPLKGLYLLGFYSQRHDLYTKKPKKELDSNDSIIIQGDDEI